MTERDQNGTPDENEGLGKHPLDTIATTKKELEELNDIKRPDVFDDKPIIDPEDKSYDINPDDRIKNLFNEKGTFVPSK